MIDKDLIRRRWLERLGQPAILDFPFAAIEEVFPVVDGISIATVEVGSGSISVSDRLEAVGFIPGSTCVEVLRIESPVPERREVSEIAFAPAGSVVGVHLAHDPAASIIPGQCLAPAGRLETTTRVVADVWCLPPDDLPGTPLEQLALFDAITAGHGLELFVHTRAVRAHACTVWRPSPGAEAEVEFELDAPIAVYPGTRFGLCYEGLTFGAGFVRIATA